MHDIQALMKIALNCIYAGHSAVIFNSISKTIKVIMQLRMKMCLSGSKNTIMFGGLQLNV